MKTSERISSWIRERVEEAGARGVVLGMSGGIDSSVVAVLAKSGVGDKVLGLIMPCHSEPGDVEQAGQVAAEFGIETEYVDLTPVFDRLLEALPPGDRVAAGNLKARLRMATLYYFANSIHYLVMGTGNKSEIMVGYVTKYGDGGVDMLPLGDLLKTQVRELARELGILEEIIVKPPSAGLWKGQTDEGEMGISYEELDNILMAIESGDACTGLSRSTGECNQEALARVRAMMAASQHKRAPIPICEL